METYQWEGRSVKGWPSWLSFKNYAQTGDVLIIHQMEGIVTVELGDTIQKGPDGFITVLKAKLPVDGRQSRDLML